MEINNISNIKYTNFSNPKTKNLKNISPISDTFSIENTKMPDNMAASLKHKTAVDFFNRIYQNSPQKCSILLNNDDILKEVNKGPYFQDRFRSDVCAGQRDAIEKSIKKLDDEEIQYVISSLSERFKDNIKGRMLLGGLVLYSNDKQAFEYIKNKPFQQDKHNYTSGYSKDICKYVTIGIKPEALDNLDYNIIKEIEKGLNEDYDYSNYTEYSDGYKYDVQKRNKLNQYLSGQISKNDVTVYRGEKSAWMFESIPIDKEFENKIRFLVFVNLSSRKDLLFPNDNKYSSIPKQNIYDYINSKKDLTLADAMLVTKYGNDRFAQKIIDKINNAEIYDDNFKSFTLSKEFAENWANRKPIENDINGKKSEQMLSMVSTTTIKAGNQMGYSAHSGQYEFILNNNNKKMTFSNAKYDKETNTFYFDSEIEVLDS